MIKFWNHSSKHAMWKFKVKVLDLLILILLSEICDFLPQLFDARRCWVSANGHKCCRLNNTGNIGTLFHLEAASEYRYHSFKLIPQTISARTEIVHVIWENWHNWHNLYTTWLQECKSKHRTKSVHRYCLLMSLLSQYISLLVNARYSWCRTGH